MLGRPPIEAPIVAPNGYVIHDVRGPHGPHARGLWNPSAYALAHISKPAPRAWAPMPRLQNRQPFGPESLQVGGGDHEINTLNFTNWMREGSPTSTPPLIITLYKFFLLFFCSHNPGCVTLFSPLHATCSPLLAKCLWAAQVKVLG